MTPAARQYLASLAALKLAISREQDAVQLGEMPSARLTQELLLVAEDRQAYASSLSLADE